MTEDHDNDEVIELNPGDTGTGDDKGDAQGDKPEDRGDEVTPSDGADHEGSETDAARDGAATATATESATKPPGKQPMPEMVPQQRFREVNDALKLERAEKAQLLELLARQAPAAAPPPAETKPEPFDVKAKEREYTAALLNGDDEAAVDIRMQINAEITRQADERAAQAEERAFERLSQREQAKVFTEEAVSIRNEYPELDETGAKANESAIKFVVRERDALISDGESPHNALRIAAEAAAVRYGFAKASASAEPAPGNVRQIQSVTRNARAANAQPAPLSGVGDRATQAVRMDVEKMDEDEFDALPAAEKRRLRGD